VKGNHYSTLILRKTFVKIGKPKVGGFGSTNKGTFYAPQIFDEIKNFSIILIGPVPVFTLERLPRIRISQTCSKTHFRSNYTYLSFLLLLLFKLPKNSHGNFTQIWMADLNPKARTLITKKYFAVALYAKDIFIISVGVEYL